MSILRPRPRRLHPLAIGMLAVMLTGSGCHSRVDQGLPLDSLPPGWQCLLVPSNFDAPGSIFSVDSTGRKFRIADLTGQTGIVIQRSPAAFPKIVEKRSLGSNIVIGLLENAIPGVSAKLTGTLTSTTNNTVEYGDLVYEITYKQAADLAILWFNRNVTPEAGVRYFLVREAYVASRINYDINAETIAALGGETKFMNMVGVNGNLVSNESKTSYQLKQNLLPPLRTCILPSEFTPVLAHRMSTTVLWGLTERTAVPQIQVE
jgi:hypothetical protein